MISTLFGKKKITEDKLANVFVNTVLEMCSEGFPVVVAELNEAPEFIERPGLTAEDDGRFLLIVFAANLMEMDRVLEGGLDKRIRSLSLSKFAQALGENCAELEQEVRGVRSRMERLNAPSTNAVYAMTRGLFLEYELYRFQEAYYREVRAPHPIVSKRIDRLMGYFLWNWREVTEQYRIA